MSELKLQLRSALTKKFLEDGKGKLLTELNERLGVSIKTFALGPKLISISETEDMDRAEAALLLLDQRISVYSDKYSLKTKGDINDDHRDMVATMVNIVLKKIEKMPKQEFKKIILEYRPLTEETDTKPGKVVAANDAQPQATGEFAQAADAAKAGKTTGRQELIKLRDENFEPRNQNQAIAYTAIMDPEINLVVLGGSAGGGKTFVGLRAGIELLNAGKVNEILVVKPRTTTNKKDIGALKGDLASKTGPYVDSAISTTLEKLTGSGSARFKNTKFFRAVSPDFERGETYDETFVFIDEAQNLTRQEAKMLVTRIGEISGDRPVKMIITGDISGQQNDLRNEMPGLAHLIAVLGHAASSNPNGQLAKRMAFIEYSDDDSAARSELLVDINKAFNNMAANYKDINDRLDLAGQNPALMSAIKDGMEFAAGQLTAGADRTKSRYGNEARKAFPAIFGVKEEAPALHMEERHLRRA